MSHLSQPGAISQGVVANAVRVYRSTTFSHNSSGNWLAIDMDTEVFDTNGFHDPGTNPSRLTVPTSALAGYYIVCATAIFNENSSTGQRYMSIFKNGATAGPGASGEGGQGLANANGLRLSTSQILILNSGDYVEMKLFQSSGGTITIPTSADEWPHIEMARLGG